MPKNTFNWNGKISYFSGGTSGSYKMVTYTNQKWKQSIKITCEILKAYGVCRSSRVLILQPFSPWAIGQVFTEAALMCNANAYPIGLYANEFVFQKFISEIRPTHICGSIRNLIRWKKSIDKTYDLIITENIYAFVAGEKFTPKERKECSTLWNCKVIDIYGMAEFDTIAAESLDNNCLVLNPYFDYAIKIKNNVYSLEKNKIGELLIKDRFSKKWYHTGDIAKVEKINYRNAIWRTSSAISIVKRVSESTTLSDGTEINLAIITLLKKRVESIEQIQILVKATKNGEKVTILYMQNSIMKNVNKEIRLAFKENIDIMDAIKHKIITKLEVKELLCIDDFKQTKRNKIPSIIKL